MKMTKKHIIYGVIAAVCIIAVAATVALTLKTVIKQAPVAPTTSGTVSITETEAKTSIDEAAKARAEGDYETAKSLYEKARDYYRQSENLAKTAELDAMISLTESEKNNSPAPVKPRLAGEE
jgi:iron uptake system EfeUOB component EfeO/EfeM